MSTFEEYDRYDGLGLAELIRTKQISAAEVCETAIERIERINPGINAVVTPMFEIGRACVAAGLNEGPFAGVPFLLKDLLAAFKGVPLTFGSRSCRDSSAADPFGTSAVSRLSFCGGLPMRQNTSCSMASW